MEPIVKAKMVKVKEDLQKILYTMRSSETDLQDRALALEIKNIAVVLSAQAKLSYKEE